MAPEAVLKGDALDALSRALVRATTAVEQPSVKTRAQALRRVGFKPDRERGTTRGASRKVGQ